jgi:hypothetical protein
VNSKEAFRIPNADYGASDLLATDGSLIFSGNHSEFVACDTNGKKRWSAHRRARRGGPGDLEVDGKQQSPSSSALAACPSSSAPRHLRQQQPHLVFASGGTAKLPTEVGRRQSRLRQNQSAAADGQ